MTKKEKSCDASCALPMMMESTILGPKTTLLCQLLHITSSTHPCDDVRSTSGWIQGCFDSLMAIIVARGWRDFTDSKPANFATATKSQK